MLALHMTLRINAKNIKASKRRKNKLYALLIGAALSFVIVFALGALVYNSLFLIDELTVSGYTPYTAEELFEAAGISAGDKLYSFSSAEAEAAIIRKYPSISGVTFERNIPSGVTAHVKMSKAVYCVEIYGEYRKLDGNMRVLESIDGDSYKGSGLITIKLPKVDSAIAGAAIRFDETKIDRYVRSVSQAVLASTLKERINSINITDIYNVTLVCDGKYLVTLGNTDVLDEKLRFLAAVLEDDMFKNSNKATIDISDTSEASVIINNQLVLD